MILSLVLTLAILLSKTSTSSYKLNNTYKGNNFFQQFNFATGSSNGYVQYMNESYCIQNGLINSTTDQVYIGVDHTHKFPVEQARPSVRLESKVTYNSGLIIADIQHMPQGILYIYI